MSKYGVKRVNINFMNKNHQKLFVFNKNKTSKLEIKNCITEAEEAKAEAERKKRNNQTKET